MTARTCRLLHKRDGGEAAAYPPECIPVALGCMCKDEPIYSYYHIEYADVLTSYLFFFRSVRLLIVLENFGSADWFLGTSSHQVSSRTIQAMRYLG